MAPRSEPYPLTPPMEFSTDHTAAKSEPFGLLPDGRPATLFTVEGPGGLRASFTNYGATLVSLWVPDAQGQLADVVLGFDSVEGYASDANQFFGCTVGRVANRIAKGSFELDGERYTLPINNEPNHLHGGPGGLHAVLWEAEPVSSEHGRGVRFRTTSADGDQGYPGQLEVEVTYYLWSGPGEHLGPLAILDWGPSLGLEYRATTDQTTPLNLTHHSYFNLAGEGSPTVLDHELIILASQYTPADETLIPTGERDPVEGTALDFRRPTRIGERLASLLETPAQGYDHNYVLDHQLVLDEDSSVDFEGTAPRLAAVLSDPDSGRQMRVFTTQPGLQFYSGNFLNGQLGKGGKPYAQNAACCLEDQLFPDAVHHSGFPSVWLRADETYRQSTLFAFAPGRPTQDHDSR